MSSFNSALNSTCTLFSLGVYKGLFRPDAGQPAVVASGKWFGWLIAAISVCIAPILAGQESLFGYLQSMNSIYFIPIFAVVLVGLLSRRVPSKPAVIAMLGGVAILTLHYFALKPHGYHLFGGVPDVNPLAPLNDFHVAAIVFAALVAFMLIWGAIAPRSTPWVQEYTGQVKAMEPWRWAKPVGAALLILVFAIYYAFADFADAKNKPAASSAAAPTAPMDENMDENR